MAQNVYPRTGVALVDAVSLLVAAGAGLAWGVLCREGMDDEGPVYWICNLAFPWLVLAYTLGGFTRSLPVGAIAGASALVGGIVSYYDPTHSFGGALWFDTATFQSWLVVALFTGGIYGVAGTLHRRGGQLRPVAAALLVTTIATETIANLRFAYLPGPSDVAFFAMVLVVVAALPLLVLPTLKDRVVTWGVSASLAFPLASSYVVLRDLL